MTASHSSSVMLTITRSRRIPALLTSMSRSPKCSMALLISRCAPSQSATLSALTIASPPIASISATTCCAGVASVPAPSLAPPRSLTTTRAPSRANSSACSRPIPRPAPVMIATRPSSDPIGSLLVDEGTLVSDSDASEFLRQRDVDQRAADELLTGQHICAFVLRAHDHTGRIAAHSPDSEAGSRESVCRLLQGEPTERWDRNEVLALRHHDADNGTTIDAGAFGQILTDDRPTGDRVAELRFQLGQHQAERLQGCGGLFDSHPCEIGHHPRLRARGQHDLHGGLRGDRPTGLQTRLIGHHPTHDGAGGNRLVEHRVALLQHETQLLQTRGGLVQRE